MNDFTAHQMAADLLAASEVDFDESDQLTQALVGTFLFGMLTAYAMSKGQGADEAHLTAVAVFEDVLHYTPSAAQEGVQHCIEASRPGAHPTMNTILHRGIDGHAQYAQGDEFGLRENIQYILRHFQR
ncbi:MAG: hypothetical protein K2P70_02015 [Hyphomonadaceae bacterium]|nr:hypothetical protein [Hyphomonadaceae bacterium]